MTTPKRCEVCGKKKCLDMNNYDEAKCHADHALVPPDGHSSPPHRPDETEKELEKLLGEGDGEIQGHHTDCCYRPDFKKKLKSLLLSYGKEREKEVWRKCKGAKSVLKCRIDVDGGVCECCQANFDALDALNPDHSSPDEGREGRV